MAPAIFVAMAEHDLTSKIIPHLDRHLAFPLLDHLYESGLFPEEQIWAAQYELAQGTNMIDFAQEIYRKLHPGTEQPSDFAGKRENFVSTSQKLEQEAQIVLDVIENPKVAQSLRQDKLQNLVYLKDNHNLSLEQIAALYNFGRFQFTCGNYSGASEYLYHFRVLSTDTDLLLSSHWGKLASDILSGNWESALEELHNLRDLLPSSSHTDDAALAQLQSRTWFLHWALFVYFNHPEGRSLLLDTFLSPPYLNTIQASCPWILRYLTAAAILCRKSSSGLPSSKARHALKEVMKVIQMEEYQYTDPITNFMRQLYSEFDFEEAQKQLGSALKVVSDDFFLDQFKEEFLDNARYLISEAYCRIHQTINIRDLSSRLDLSAEDGEKWIVNLIRETRMGADAKIDLEKNIIQINRQPLPVYQAVIEKTRGLAFRTQALGAALTRTYGQAVEAEAA